MQGNLNLTLIRRPSSTRARLLDSCSYRHPHILLTLACKSITTMARSTKKEWEAHLAHLNACVDQMEQKVLEVNKSIVATHRQSHRQVLV